MRQLFTNNSVNCKYVCNHLVQPEKYLYNFLISEQTFKTEITVHALEVLRSLKTDPTKTLDNVDLQIIALLQEDSRLSFNKLAGKLGVSVGTAYNRVKHLEASGGGEGYKMRLDPTK